MNIREISDVFKDTADEITAIKSYNFGWASDRVRQGNTEDFQELNEFPRIFFSVPTITGSDQTRKQDTYQVTLFFDDLLGYDNEGDEDPTLQIDKWANLQQYANYFIQRLNKIKQSILPNYLFIPEAPSITFDSFTGIQRMITVQLSFNLVVPTNCEASVIKLVECIANIVTSSNLTASINKVLKITASLEGRATLTADIALVQKVASSLNAFGTLTGDITFVKNMQAALNGTAALSGGITFVQKPEASLNAFGTLVSDLKIAKTFESSLNANGTLVSNATIAKILESSLTSSNSLAANALVSKLASASLTGAGTTAANLTVASAFDADAQAFFDRVTAAGGVLTLIEKDAVNTLVLNLKSNNIWTLLKAIYPMVGSSAAACSQNLKSSSFTGTFSGGWTFASTGITPNGTNAYMNTVFAPNANLTFNSVSFSIYSRTNVNPSTNQSWGCASNSNDLPLLGATLLATKAVYSYIYSYTVPDSMQSATNQVFQGLFSSSRTSETSAVSYKNSTLIASTTTNAQTTQPSSNFLLGAIRNGLNNIIDYSTFEIAFAHIGDGLNATQIGNFYTAVQAFQTNLSRQV